MFLQWAIMQGVAMLLQNRYQRQRLCTHIALGKARRMDVVWGETAGVNGQLWLLAPILFILQLNQSFLQRMNGSSFLLVEGSTQMSHKVREQLNLAIGKPLGKNEM
ncbi:unnamed protein product [Camellia sinensis]